ncbi:MAG: hypothetical protein EPO65_00560 [Dehalococcoidia bacterium]|nr:MAG: hypothetical protein EPO65_00560 [Dehalococcoidia bacterium]
MRITLAAILYTLALALGVLGTMENDIRLLFWSLIVTKPAALITVYIMGQSDRLNLERLLDRLVERARQRKRADVTPIR